MSGKPKLRYLKPRTAGNPVVRIHFAVVRATEIFGMVGRCGGGYNTVWEDWSEQGRRDRELIMKEFEDGMNQLFGHYEKLEHSILTYGFLNPLIVTCGYPLVRRMEHLPPELRIQPPSQLLLLEGGTGGSRLWVAQKHNLNVPCIINDRTNRFIGYPQLTLEQVKMYFHTPPTLTLSAQGVREVPGSGIHLHLGSEHRTDAAILEPRTVLYYKTMKKYGRKIRLPSSLAHLQRKLDSDL